MKRLLQIILPAILLFSVQSAWSYEKLIVQDPQRTWRYGDATIEEAVISIRPKGVYMEYGLYLTISAEGLNFSQNDILEIIYHFELPENAIVHDLWLWVGEDIMRARMYDRWTASNIYNGIVNRQQDPAIIFKESPTRYRLLIYPMRGNESRKIKLTYLVPTDWNEESVLAKLPTEMLNLSHQPLSVFNVLFWPNDEWHSPKIQEFPDISFTLNQHPTAGNYYQANLPPEAIETTLNFSLNSPMEDGVYVNQYPTEDGGIYQLAFLPSQAMDVLSEKKVLFLIDHVAEKTTIDISGIIAMLKSQLLSNFTGADSFNVMVAENLNIHTLSQNWIPGSVDSIEARMNQLQNSDLNDYSLILQMVNSSIEYIHTREDNACIFIISSADHLGDFLIANPLINLIYDASGGNIPISIFDYANLDLEHHFFGGRTYWGNEYLYKVVSRQTNGVYRRVFSNSQAPIAILGELFESTGGFINAFDFHTSLENGFCYARYNITNQDNGYYIGKPFLQVGKYYGNFPFEVDASGLYNNMPVFTNITVPEEDILNSDSLAEEIWTGNYIHDLESQPQTNPLIGEIIDISLAERVLSRYTAFLALEPSDTVQPCTDCYDETGLVTGIEELNDTTHTDTLKLTAFPNPFNASTTIEMRLPQNFYQTPEELSFRIFNVLGQQVKKFAVNQRGNRHNFRFEWDGLNDRGATVASGVYLFVANSQSQRKVLKLILMK